MRNPLAAVLACFVVAVAIAGTWYFTSSHYAVQAAPQTVAAKQADPLPPAAAKLAAKDDVEATASIANRVSAMPQANAAPAPALAAAIAPKPACANPDALGVGRVVEIDTSGGPGFGFEQFKQLDFLEPKEVVLTFDDGPWPGNTPAVLKALADEIGRASCRERV